MIARNSILFFLIITSFYLSSCKKSEDAIEEIYLPKWEVGDVFFDSNEWTECIVGDMPLVISVPHGGDIKPANIPERTCTDATTVKDSYTIEVAKAIEEEMFKKYGKKPFIIISHLARTKVDHNRALDESSCGNSDMNATWHQFHNYIDTALAVAVEKYGHALYIDLHAHGHTIQRLEVGYSLTTSELGKVNSGIELQSLGNKSSLINLLKIRQDLDVRQLFVGDKAFGTLMANREIPSVPSKQNPYPLATELYFSGGYNTRYFTSLSYPNVYGWQIEMNSAARNTKAQREKFAAAFVESINEFTNNINP